MADNRFQQFENSLRVLTPAALESYGELEKAKFTTGDFSYGGIWTNNYRLFAVSTTTWYRTHRGYITISKKEQPLKDVLKLSIERDIILSYQAAHQKTTIDMLCRDDELGRPTDWTLDNAIVDFADGQEKVCSKYNEISRLAGTLLVKDYVTGRITMRYTGFISSDLSLLAVVQKYGKEPPDVTFTMLEEMDKPKPGQSLRYIGIEKFKMAGTDITSHCYQQLGCGILPTNYYVDSKNGRLLLVISGMKAYILDDGYMETHKKAVEFLTKRGPQK